MLRRAEGEFCGEFSRNRSKLFFCSRSLCICKYIAASGGTMRSDSIDGGRNNFAMREAARFWEPRRMVYNGILTVIVLLWLVLTWPHFRPAMTLSALVAMLVLAFFANVCYCAAYGAELALQPLVSNSTRNRWRWVLWIAGTIFAIVFENYWIADEIYPDAVN